MTIADQIRMLCARMNISMAELARRIGCSPQNLNAKLKRESFTVRELERIAEAAGATFSRKFVTSDKEEI